MSVRRLPGRENIQAAEALYRSLNTSNAAIKPPGQLVRLTVTSLWSDAIYLQWVTKVGQAQN